MCKRRGFPACETLRRCTACDLVVHTGACTLACGTEPCSRKPMTVLLAPPQHTLAVHPHRVGSRRAVCVQSATQALAQQQQERCSSLCSRAIAVIVRTVPQSALPKARSSTATAGAAGSVEEGQVVRRVVALLLVGGDGSEVKASSKDGPDAWRQELHACQQRAVEAEAGTSDKEKGGDKEAGEAGEGGTAAAGTTAAAQDGQDGSGEQTATAVTAAAMGVSQRFGSARATAASLNRRLAAAAVQGDGDVSRTVVAADTWEADDARGACPLCERPFTSFHRRHHCRFWYVTSHTHTYTVTVWGAAETLCLPTVCRPAPKCMLFQWLLGLRLLLDSQAAPVGRPRRCQHSSQPEACM